MKTEVNRYTFKLPTDEAFFLVGVLKPTQFTGHLLLPYAAVESEKGLFEAVHLLPTLNIDSNDPALQLVKDLHNLAQTLDANNLVKRFSKKQLAPKEFFSGENQKVLDRVVFPFIWKQFSEIFRLLSMHHIPVFDQRFWPKLYDENLLVLRKQEATTRLYFDKGENQTTYRLEAWMGTTQIRLQDASNQLLTKLPCHFKYKNSLIRFESNLNGQLLKPFLSKDEIVIPSRIEKDYFEKFIRRIAGTSNIEAQGFTINDIQVKPSAHLMLEQSWDNSTGLTLRFEYGEKKFNCDDPKAVATTLLMTDAGFEFQRLKRDLNWEMLQVEKLLSVGFKRVGSFFFIDGQSSRFSFISKLSEFDQTLTDLGFTIHQHPDDFFLLGQPRLDITKVADKDWFDLTIQVVVNGLTFPFVWLRDHLLNGERIYLLKDGSKFLIPEAWFERYHDLFVHGKQNGKQLKIKSFHKTLLDNAGFGSDEQPEDDFKLSETSQLVIPNKLLRPYQEYGFFWLRRHYHVQTGALLADDMGLGKTIQVISLLDAHFERYRTTGDAIQKKKQRSGGQLQLFEEQSPDQDPAAEVEKPRPALVVMPTSLIHNWKEEFKRFAPLLRIYEFTGNNRNLQLALGGDFHVLLTTYGVMRIESYDLSQYPFSFVVLDESQQIKNPASKTAQAVFILNGKHRIAMTGTPVENHLSDLWSQMNFLNPGLLGDLSVFNKYYSVPISRDAQSKQREKLLRIISPFVLRRTKHQVAKELPPVTENYVFCGMSEMQRQRYEEEKSRMRIALMDEVDENVRRSEVAVRYLTALMKLRQLANHPGILFPDENSESGKFAELLQHLETILDENHKVLIFSSFVSLLAILAGELEKLNVSYAMLTGETQHREDVVKSFKNGNKHVFLISLKAGGVGLNLAEADYVFVLDPWWNPAAEAQAIGRSHRIGQQRSVFVYRFITRNSIEEKIMKLQAEKKILAESTIVEESFYSSMSREQLLGLLQDETESPEQDAEM